MDLAPPFETGARRHPQAMAPRDCESVHQQTTLRGKPAQACQEKATLSRSLGSEPLGRAGDRLAAERTVELDRGFVVRQRPHHEALQAALREVLARRGEELAAEAEPLEFRAQVDFVDFAIVVEAACAVAAIVGVPGHAVAEGDDRDPTAFADRAVPPVGAAPVDELVQLGAWDDALIGTPPRLVVGRSDGPRVTWLGPADLYEGGAHRQIEASTQPTFKSYI